MSTIGYQSASLFNHWWIFAS